MPSSQLFNIEGGRSETVNTLSVCGVNHKQADISLREKFAVSAQDAPEILSRIVSLSTVTEAVMLSTCNRVEVIAARAEGFAAKETAKQIGEVFSSHSGVCSSEFEPALYGLVGRCAVHHVFRVASGLDSMVVGESQILGQMKSAYQIAQEQGATASVLNGLFSRAFGVAKRIRTETAIGKNAVSVAYAAKVLAEQIFGDLSGKTVMLIGAGETGALALKHFQAAGAGKIYVVSKNLGRASELADAVGGIPARRDDLAALLPEADVVIGAAAVTEPILLRDNIKQAFEKRGACPQFYINLGVPRNFAADLDSLADVFLYTVDDLSGVVKDNISEREAEAKQAEILVTEEVDKFAEWLELRKLDPTLRSLNQQVDELRAREIEKTIRRIKRDGTGELELTAALDDFSKSLIAKTLHQPINTLKERGAKDKNLVDAFVEFFLARK